MNGKSFMNGVANGKKDILDCFLGVLGEVRARYCVIGGLGVNAYVEPVVSLDLDFIIATDALEAIRRRAKSVGLRVEPFEHRVNVASTDSDLRIQLQTDPRYQEFLARAVPRSILGYDLQVACLEDVLQGKSWAYLDESRRRSKRQKDLADITRLIESYPNLRDLLPERLRRLVE